MATFDYEIVNLALVRLGATRITSLVDGSRNAQEANAIYTLVRDEVLRSHTWAWATRTARLQRYVPKEVTITGITQANPAVISFTLPAATDLLEDGDVVTTEGVGGMVEFNDLDVVVHTVTDLGAGNYSCVPHDAEGAPYDSTLYAAYTVGGTMEEQVPGLEGFAYLWLLPSDMLRIITMNGFPIAEHEVTEKGLLCNLSEVEIHYIRRVTSVPTYDATFVDTLAWKLAQELAIVITGSKEKATMAAEMHIRTLPVATTLDARQNKTEYPKFTRYADSRR